MEVTFFHDHRFKIDFDGNYYSLGGLSNESFKSYLNYFDKITVVAREERIKNESINKYTEVKLENLYMDCFDYVGNLELLGLKGFRRKIRAQVVESEIIIARVPSFIGTMALEEAQKIGKPAIVEVVANAWDGLWNYGNLSGKILAPIMQIRNKRVIKNATHVVYVTENYLQKVYPSSGESIAISNVVLTELSENVLKKRIEKKIMNPIVIGTIGNLEAVAKGQKYVIEALPLISNEFDIEYHLVGSGSNERLKKICDENKVSDKVKFIGSLSHQDIFKWLDTIDLYIQPSKQEGLPRALIEAMSRGIPCLGSSTAGIPELLDEEEIFSNKNKKKEISKTINRILNTDFEKISKKNFEKSKKYQKTILDRNRCNFYDDFLKVFSENK